MKFYCTDKEAVLDELGARVEGLSSEEAQKRLEQNGKNKLAAAKGKSIIRRFLEQLADPMIIILLVAALISGLLAFTPPTDADCISPDPPTAPADPPAGTAFEGSVEDIAFCVRIVKCPTMQ